MVVSFNYRLGALGFPSARIFEEEGLLNLGILDQRQLLRFVQKHVSSFGGDPDAVTIGGLSAGAHSVGIHLFHDYGDTEQLFARAWMQSGSVTARAFPGTDYDLYRRQFDEFLALTGCGDIQDDKKTLSCLRSVSEDKVRNATGTIYLKYDPVVTWPWQPVHGGPMFEKPGSVSGIDETFFRVPVLTTTTSDEAKAYVPTTLETNEQYLDFFRGISPDMNDDDFKQLESLYPDPARDPASPYSGAPNSTQYDRVSATWGDYAYNCPSQETAYRVSKAGAPAWKLRWDTGNNTPGWQGVPHATDMRYTWAEPTAQYPEIGKVYHAYLTSFVLTGNPNVLRLEGTPEWPQWAEADAKQLVVKPTGAEVERDSIREEACLFWRDSERAGRLHK